MANKQIINVLCLHGCNQTEAMFKDLLRNYIRLGEKQYGLMFHFMEAKFDHPLGGKTWYKRPLNVADIGKIVYDDDLVGETLDDLSRAIDEKHIDVLLGFSQGANVVDTYLAHKEDNRVKRAVIMSGYSFVDPNRKQEIDVPVISVVSEADDIVPHDLNPTNYRDQHIIKHDKGHKLPTSNPVIREICGFMETGVQSVA